MSAALEIENLQKTYPGGVEALKRIDLDVRHGDFFALLGPNGAGKSTVIGIISSLVNKTAGSVRIYGHDIDNDFSAAKSCLGLVPQEFNFNMFEKVEHIVVNQAGYYGIPRPLAYQRAETYLTLAQPPLRQRTSIEPNGQLDPGPDKLELQELSIPKSA